MYVRRCLRFGLIYLCKWKLLVITEIEMAQKLQFLRFLHLIGLCE